MGDIRDALFNLGYTRLISDGQNYRTSANYRGGLNKTSLSINKKTGKFVDFGIGLSGSLEDLVKLTLKDENVNFEEFLKKHSIETEDFYYIEEPKIKMEKIWDKKILTHLLPHYKFYNERGISDETLRFFRSGFSHDGEMNQRYVFPIFNKDGNIHGFSGRDMLGYRDIKWKHIGGKKSWIYPAFMYSEDTIVDGSKRKVFPVLEAIAKTRQIIIVESIGDMLRLWEYGIKNVIVSFGLRLSSKQLSFISAQNVDEVVVATNNDLKSEKNNGKEGALIMFLQLMEWMELKKLKIVLPSFNDFGEMSDEDIAKWHNKIKVIRKDIMYKAILDKMKELYDKGKLSKTQYKLAPTIKRFYVEEYGQIKSVQN